MPEIRLSCPTCSQRLSASTDALRTRMSCPRCGAEFLPMDVIPPQLTLPAMPVVTLEPAATPGSTPGNLFDLDGATGVLPPTATATPGPVAAPVAAPAEAQGAGAEPPALSPFAVLHPKAAPSGSPAAE